MDTHPPSADALWAAKTFGSAQLPDRRLVGRVVEVAACLASAPGKTIPQASGSPAATKAAYRLLENRRMSYEPLIKAAGQATARDCAAQPMVLVVQDTTAISLPGLKQCAGLGPLGEEHGVQGLFLHGAVALRLDGLPLGLLHAEIWARDPASHGQAERRKERPFAEKESARWVRGLAAAHARLAELPCRGTGTRLIHVMDREGDIHEVFAEVEKLSAGALIRCAHNRRVEGPEAHAHQAVRAAPLLGRVEVNVPRSKKWAARKAQTEIRVQRVTLHPNRDQQPERQSLNLTLVEVWEPAPPPGAEPLHWYLWTTEEVQSLADALRLVGYYSLRWRIEDVHLVLKEGCRVEQLQLETAERLEIALALYMAMAVRIVALREAARREPEAPCTRVLQEAEWRTLWTKRHGRPPAREQPPPTLREAALWIGRLGGHLGRKGDGMPGVRALWSGWRDLMAMTDLYVALRGDT